MIRKETMKLPPQVRASMDRTWTQSSPACLHVLLSSYIWQVDDRYMHAISLQLDSSASAAPSRPARSPKRTGTFQTWFFCGSFRFWRPTAAKGQQLEAVACPAKLHIESTTRCWYHKPGCPVWILSCAVGTPEFEGLLLSRSILVDVALSWRKYRKSGTLPRWDLGNERVHTAS